MLRVCIIGHGHHSVWQALHTVDHPDAAHVLGLCLYSSEFWMCMPLLCCAMHAVVCILQHDLGADTCGFKKQGVL